MLSTQLGAIMFILFTGSCTILAFTVLKKVGVHGRLGIMNVGMFTGILLVFLSALTEGVYASILHIATPLPSTADTLNFLGYASAAIGVLQFLWYFRAAFNDWRFRLIPLLGVLVAGPNLVLSHPSMTTQDLLVDATWLAYPILDAFLVVLAVMIFLLFSDGIFSSAWRWLAIGVMLVTIADAIIGVGNIQGWNQIVQPFYLFYFWGYICLGLGFSLMPRLERLRSLEPDYHTTKFMKTVD